MQPAAIVFQFQLISRDKFHNGELADRRIERDFKSAVADNQRFRDRFRQQMPERVFLGYVLPKLPPARRELYVVHIGHHDVGEAVNDDRRKPGVQLADFHSRRRNSRPEATSVGIELAVHLGKLFT